MGDRCADLRFDIVADDRQPALLEALLPVRLRGDENGDAIHEAATRLEHLLDVPLRRHLGTHWQIGNHYIGLGLAENLHDVLSRARAPFRF